MWQALPRARSAPERTSAGGLTELGGHDRLMLHAVSGPRPYSLPSSRTGASDGDGRPAAWGRHIRTDWPIRAFTLDAAPADRRPARPVRIRPARPPRRPSGPETSQWQRVC